MPTRRRTLGTVIALSTVVLLLTRTAGFAAKMNVLFIAVDDLRPVECKEQSNNEENNRGEPRRSVGKVRANPQFKRRCCCTRNSKQGSYGQDDYDAQNPGKYRADLAG